ncbi:MAG: phosphoribosyltransferase [Myxococcaceae bacterium]|nr:phosphoribosyltransferase [Myxococcaceae bacterium]
MRFRDREEAGRKLAGLLGAYQRESPIVLALPRGGVPVAAEIARALHAPLDVWIVRKLGAPWNPELGMGAVAEGGVVYVNDEIVRAVGASAEDVAEVAARESAEVIRRARRFRPQGRPPDMRGRTVILVDDGIATGGTATAAVQSLRAAGAKKIVLAVPVASTDAVSQLQTLADAVLCLHITPALGAIGAWYDDFRQLDNEEVQALLDAAHAGEASAQADPPGQMGVRELVLPVRGGELYGTLSTVPGARGLVIFAHGSGSSRFSPRNRQVASMLHGHGLSTLLFDLLTEREEEIDALTAELRFDIPLLARRLVEVTDWTMGHLPDAGGGRIGYFGSSTGAAAALMAAAARPSVIGAVVSRGGRPDLAAGSLSQVRAPTLLIVGGADEPVIELNHRAARQMSARHRIVLVPNATHLFEEPGALEMVGSLAGAWFSEHLGRTISEPVASEGEDALAPE